MSLGLQITLRATVPRPLPDQTPPAETRPADGLLTAAAADAVLIDPQGRALIAA